MKLLSTTLCKKFLSIYLFSIIGFSTVQIVAQSKSLPSEFIFNQWTVDDGLPVNEIISIVQTQEGYLWLATFDGLVRFDGAKFKTFNTANTPAFSTNRIEKLAVDGDNNLWILPERQGSGKKVIKYAQGQFKVFGSTHGFEGEIRPQLNSKGQLLLNTRNGAFFYDGKIIKSFGDELKGKSVRKILDRGERGYWFATDQGIWIYNEHRWTQLPGRKGLSSQDIYTIQEDHQDRILICSKTHFSIWDHDSIIKHLKLPHLVKKGAFINIHPNKSNEVILVVDKRFEYLHKKDKLLSLSNIEGLNTHKYDLRNSASDVGWTHTQKKVFRGGQPVYQTNSTIKRMYLDKEENIWLTQNDGLVQLKPKLFKAFDQNISVVYAMIEDKEETVWAVQKFTDLFQSKGDHFQQVVGNAGIDQVILSLHISSDSIFWMGTNNGVYRWDKKKPAVLFNAAKLPDSLAPLQGVRTIQEDEEGNLWFGGTFGLHQLDRKGNWRHFGRADGQQRILVRIILFSQDGTLWAGTNGEGMQYLQDGKLHPLAAEQKLSGDIIRSIYEDEEGILWVGTEGWGLNRLELEQESGAPTAQITIFNKQNGLFDNIIHQILEDAYGRLWMSSNRGIFWVNRSELNEMAEGKVSSIYSFSYDEQDGLPGREANGGMQPAGIKSAKGELCFPMMGGIAHIDPDKIVIPQLNVFVEEVSTRDSSYFIGKKTSQALPLGQRNLKIAFTALNLSTSPTNVRYRYKMEGEDPDWTETRDYKEAIYNKLGPGKYTFHVMANNGGGWAKNRAALNISIPYFFYETYWFYALIILIITLSIYAGVNWRIRALKEQGKELEKKVELRTQELKKEKEETERQKITIEKQAEALMELDRAKSHFFTNVSHEFRTPLTLIIGPLEDYISKFQNSPNSHTEDMEMALRNSKRLLKLVNQLLEVAKLESGHIKLNAQVIDIRTVIESVTDAFLSLAERNGTQFVSKIPGEPVWIYCDADLIEKALINLVSNAFKFTPKDGLIEIQLVPNNEHVIISVKDNGAGIPQTDQKHVFDRFHQVSESISDMQVGTGIGLSLVRELILLHEGEIELESELGEGSEFLIKLPKGTAYGNLSSVAEKQDRVDSGALLEEPLEADIPLNGNAGTDLDQPILLIVEDNADIRKYIRKHFSPAYQIIEAENGLEGYQKAQAELPDLIISDVMMPIMDGYELCRQIKQHPDLDFIPVILLTAKAETSQKIEGLEIGADDYVIKPFQIEELKARVNNLIQSRKKLKERLTHTQVSPDTSNFLGWGNSPFAKQARSIINENIDNENFSVVQLAESLNIGRTTLYSRILEQTGKTPIEVIKLSRIHRAAQLLKEDSGNISEIAYTTGFKSVSHFSKTFKGEFDLTPTEYKRAYAG